MIMCQNHNLCMTLNGMTGCKAFLRSYKAMHNHVQFILQKKIQIIITYQVKNNYIEFSTLLEQT